MMTDRTFQSRIVPGQWLGLVLFALLAGWGLWERHVVAALAGVILLVLAIERMIHTAYVLTADGHLHVSRGRFARVRVVPVDQIQAVDPCASWRLCGIPLAQGVALHLRDGQTLVLSPADAEGFIRQLQRVMENPK